MHDMNFMKLLRTVAISAALLPAVNANAMSISGVFGAGAYDTVSFSVASAGVVDFQMTGGYRDPSISLFNSSGTHLITNDDASDSFLSHITQNLSAGTYSLVVGACCGFISAGIDTESSTDGFNNGTYYLGNTTLSGLTSYLDSNPNANGVGATYSLTITAVPELETYVMLLTGLGLMGGIARRKQK
jgi:hypothetical protein